PHSRPDPLALPRRLLLLAAGRADRRAGGTVRRRRLRSDLRPAAADLPRRRLLLGNAAARAVSDPDPLQPDLLHDQLGPLRLRRLHRSQHRPLVAGLDRSDRCAFRHQSATLLEGLPPTGVKTLRGKLKTCPERTMLGKEP